MTNEEKELLLKDLSARFPYGVMCDRFGGAREVVGITRQDGNIIVSLSNGDYMPSEYCIEEIKPYLRPIWSMTEDEKKEYRELCSNCLEPDMVDYNISTLDDSQLIFVIEFHYSHHIDFRGLIEKGLAIEVTEEDNPYNE